MLKNVFRCILDEIFIYPDSGRESGQESSKDAMDAQDDIVGIGLRELSQRNLRPW